MAIASFYTYPPAGQAGSESPEDSAQRVADRVNPQLGGKPPAGGVYHAEGRTDDGGWWSFDVWASEEDERAFRDTILQPALDEVGAPAPSEVRKLQVWWDSSQMRGGSEGTA